MARATGRGGTENVTSLGIQVSESTAGFHPGQQGVQPGIKKCYIAKLLLYSMLYNLQNSYII